MMQFHPHSEIFPMMSTDEFVNLIADIRMNGLREEITLLDGKILDGRNRYRAMLRVDEAYSPERNPSDFKQFSGSDDPLKWVVSKNLHRRHLNESQRSIIGARLSLANPGTNRWHKGLSSPKAASLMNVSAGLVNAAKRVIKERPDKVSGIMAGEDRVGRHFENDGCVSVTLGFELKNKFDAFCSELQRSNSDVLRDLIQQAIDGKINLRRSETAPTGGGRPRGTPIK